jgi:hypothetical protein
VSRGYGQHRCLELGSFLRRSLVVDDRVVQRASDRSPAQAAFGPEPSGRVQRHRPRFMIVKGGFWSRWGRLAALKFCHPGKSS